VPITGVGLVIKGGGTENFTFEDGRH